MGVLNVTPDSFSDGGFFVATDKALAQAEKMLAEGADIIDVGGESTRPGAADVSPEEELQRVIPVIEAIKSCFPQAVVSVDTSKPQVMRRAIACGASMVNDVNALRASGALEVVQKHSVAVCLMHMQGKPRTMQQNPQYEDVVAEVYQFLQLRVQACQAAGINRERLVVDPGFGFGKTVEQNMQLVKHTSRFLELGLPLIMGMSRKSSIGAILDKPAEQRLSGSLALACVASWLGAHILRVHDVAQTRDALTLVQAVKNAN